jgi:hypothetical protein
VKKKIIIGVCVVVVIIVGLVIYTLSNLDSIVKSVIESAGTKATGTKVTVTGVKISLSKGEATIKGLKVANPQGFSDDSMIDFGEITAQVDYKTGAIKNIHIGSPYFLLEQKGTKTNFGVIQQNLSKKSSKQASGKSTGSEGTTESGKKEAKIYQIDSFSINDAQITVTSLDTGKSAKVKSGKIQFRNLKGTPDEICQQIIAQITAQIIQASAQQAIQQTIKQEVQKNIKGNVGKAINQQLNNFLSK